MLGSACGEDGRSREEHFVREGQRDRCLISGESMQSVDAVRRAGSHLGDGAVAVLVQTFDHYLELLLGDRHRTPMLL